MQSRASYADDELLKVSCLGPVAIARRPKPAPVNAPATTCRSKGPISPVQRAAFWRVSLCPQLLRCFLHAVAANAVINATAQRLAAAGRLMRTSTAIHETQSNATDMHTTRQD